MFSMEHDAWFFIGVFAFIFIIWIAVGGPKHPISFTGPTLSAPSPLGTGGYLRFPLSPFGIGGTIISLPGSSNGGSVYGTYGSSGTTIPTLVGGATYGTPSIYRGIVTMNGYVSGAASSNPDDEYIELSVADNANVPVDISGWTISSGATGSGAVIPKVHLRFRLQAS